MAGKPKDTPSDKSAPKRTLLQRLFSFLKKLLLVCVCFLVSVLVFSYPHWMQVKKETIAMADQHQNYFTSHAGWSYPGTIWSASVPLYTSPKRLVKHAKIRQYKEQCPPQNPGEFCSKSGKVIPRGGIFPEGKQPPGTENWNRALALEPIRIGMLIGEDGELREHLPVDEAPQVLIDAILSSEDENFYRHKGVNVVSLLRAFVINLREGSYAQGASTISMQVVRNLSQKKKKTLLRKFDEIAAAYFLDEYLSKSEILQMYLNTPYLGQHNGYSICGFAMAARHYYGKSIRDISLDEAATLVGILPAPGRFRPDLFPEKAKKRRNMVLRKMAQIKNYQIGHAWQKPIEVGHLDIPEPKYPSYLQYVQSWLKQHYDKETLYGSGLQVFTALDVVLQEESNRIIPAKLRYLQKTAKLKYSQNLEAATTIIDPKRGTLLAVYGGTMDKSTDFNRATQARRQAGSAFKPLVYALAFMRTDKTGRPIWRSFDTVHNYRKTFEGTDGWRPRNTSGRYTRTTTLASGLARSKNVATASLLERVGGPEPLIELARLLEFDVDNYPQEMGLALGQAEVTPLEMTRFVATIANGGNLTRGVPVISAKDLLGRERIMYSPIGDQILHSEPAALLRELMRLVVTSGTGYNSRGVGRFPGYLGSAIGKTGTTDQNKDLWFIGSTPQYAAALWIGLDKPENLMASASDYAAPLWGWWMEEIHKDIDEDDDFPGLSLKSKTVCMETGKYTNKSCPVIAAPLLKGQKPNGSCGKNHPKIEKKYVGLWSRSKKKIIKRKPKKKKAKVVEKTTAEIKELRKDLIEQRLQEKEEEDKTPRPVPFE